MKSLLVATLDVAGDSARLACAIDVARQLRAHLECLEIIVPPAIGASGYSTGELAVIEVERTRASAARTRDRLEREGIDFTWRETIGAPDAEVIRATRLVDLVVASFRRDHEPREPLDLSPHLLRKIGRAVLAVPRSAMAVDLAAGAVVAWDGSDEAEAALRAAVPLLQVAGKTALLSVGADPQQDMAVEQAAAYCSRHGIDAQIYKRSRNDHAVAEQIYETCKLLGAGFIVAGAFGHAPLREAVFGGVSKSLLAASPLPMMLAHRG
jgi:nucleotide-binding universal stress UspA family protein